jgi:hypothetical protein
MISLDLNPVREMIAGNQTLYHIEQDICQLSALKLGTELLNDDGLIATF